MSFTIATLAVLGAGALGIYATLPTYKASEPPKPVTIVRPVGPDYQRLSEELYNKFNARVGTFSTDVGDLSRTADSLSRTAGALTRSSGLYQRGVKQLEALAAQLQALQAQSPKPAEYAHQVAELTRQFEAAKRDGQAKQVEINRLEEKIKEAEADRAKAAQLTRPPAGVGSPYTSDD